MADKFLSQKQRKLLNTIKKYINTYDQAPSINELKEELNYASKRAVTYHLEILEDKGYIQRSSEARGIIVNSMVKGNFVYVPIMGYANAGYPLITARDEYLGELTIDKRLLLSTTNLLAVEIHGDSMNNRIIGTQHLCDGSYAVISKGSGFTNNDVVLAVIDGSTTVKTFTKKGNLVVLHPESTNKKHKPIYIDKDSGAYIIGKVIRVLNDPTTKTIIS